jgi:hypothetical protein
MDVRKRGCEMKGNGLGLCLMAGYGINGVEPLILRAERGCVNICHTPGVELLC